MHPNRRWFAPVVGLGLALQASAADAIVVARVTHYGYIVTDDNEQWGDAIPVSNTQSTVAFLQEVTAALQTVEGFHEGRFLAAMQVPPVTSPLAFYLPIRNDVRGIGQHSPLDARAELFDLNGAFGTAFPLDGFVFLNSYLTYLDARTQLFGRFLICTQEFGHRYGATMTVPPYPDSVADGGVGPDASTGDGGLAPLAREALLGRGNQLPSGMVVNRSHWSYFFNTGGSPMEGNNWTEVSPGTFRAAFPSFRFSPLDLYSMGLIPASEVTPTFLIDSPEGVPRDLNRDSAPNYTGRPVTIRGRRVDLTIADIQRANGVRVPAYPTAERDLDVVWVLLATPDQVTDELAAGFDNAISSCASGYAMATANRGRLVTTVPYDGGEEAPDAAVDEDVPTEEVADAGLEADAGTDSGSAAPDASRATTDTAGCGCHTTGGTRRPEAWWGALALAVTTWSRRRRRRGAQSPGTTPR